MNDLIIFCEGIEGAALDQIYALAKFPAYQDVRIRIMSDAQAGKGCTVGTTMTIRDKVRRTLWGWTSAAGCRS